jgi:hypothetical protein
VVGDWRRLHSGNFNACTLHQVIKGDYINKDEVGGTCSLHEGDE